MSNNNLKEKIQELKRNVIFNSSLGSKELFHSNIWATYMEKYKEFIKVFLKI